MRSLRSRSVFGRGALRCAIVLGVIAAACADAPAGEFTGDAAWAYLVKQTGFGPRVPGSAAHDSTQRFIVDKLRDGGALVKIQRFELPDPYGDGVLRPTNIIGSLRQDAGRRLLLAAHYDSRPWADQERSDSLRALPVPGANDGASGVAVLLELADILAQQPPDIGVDLVFFDCEDYGKKGDINHYFLGSKYFAANLAGYRPEAGILLDMVGGKDARIRQERNSLSAAPDLTRDLFTRAARLGLDVFVAQPGESVMDDHIPLLQAGIPMVDLIEFPYRQWHTLGDTPAACSQETLRQVGALLVDFVYSYGD